MIKKWIAYIDNNCWKDTDSLAALIFYAICLSIFSIFLIINIIQVQFISNEIVIYADKLVISSNQTGNRLDQGTVSLYINDESQTRYSASCAGLPNDWCANYKNTIFQNVTLTYDVIYKTKDKEQGYVGKLSKLEDNLTNQVIMKNTHAYSSSRQGKKNFFIMWAMFALVATINSLVLIIKIFRRLNYGNRNYS